MNHHLAGHQEESIHREIKKERWHSSSPGATRPSTRKQREHTCAPFSRDKNSRTQFLIYFFIYFKQGKSVHFLSSWVNERSDPQILQKTKKQKTNLSLSFSIFICCCFCLLVLFWGGGANFLPLTFAPSLIILSQLTGCVGLLRLNGHCCYHCVAVSLIFRTDTSHSLRHYRRKYQQKFKMMVILSHMSVATSVTGSFVKHWCASHILYGFY